MKDKEKKQGLSILRTISSLLLAVTLFFSSGISIILGFVFFSINFLAMLALENEKDKENKQKYEEDIKNYMESIK